MKRLIEQLKQIRKRAYISKSNRSRYAFVGMGNHSINILFPIIHYLRLDLKYIVTKSFKNAKLIDEHFSNSIGTSDLVKVLSDSEITAIFICATPSSHFELVKKALGANKNVFIEKPPCLTLAELLELVEVEKVSTGKCLVGLQKQYAPANIKLQKLVGKKCTYNYRYVTGAYPEGDPYYDLFIHPLSFIVFLFGKATVINFTRNQSHSGSTDFLIIQHENGTTGIIELSTDYSWSSATDKMIINTDQGMFELNEGEDLILTPKRGTFLGIPKDKLYGDITTKTTLYLRGDFAPIFQNNQLYSKGYFSAIENFVKLNESEKYINNSTLSSCVNVYKLINQVLKCTEKMIT